MTCFSKRLRASPEFPQFMGKINALFIFFYNSFAMFSVQLEKRNKTLKRYDQICFPKNSWFSIESMSANLLELTFPNVSRYTTREHTFISQPANNWGPFLIKYHWPQWCEVMQQLEGSQRTPEGFPAASFEWHDVCDRVTNRTGLLHKAERL